MAIRLLGVLKFLYILPWVVDLVCSSSARMRLSCSILAMMRSISDAGAGVVDHVVPVLAPLARNVADSSSCNSSQRTVSNAAYERNEDSISIYYYLPPFLLIDDVCIPVLDRRFFIVQVMKRFKLVSYKY